MIRSSHRDFAKSAARTARIREKAVQIKNRVRKSAESFVMRYQARMAWWRRAFRTPSFGLLQWATSQAKTLWAAFLAILGLSPKSWGRSVSRRSSAVRQSYFRTALCEGLEERQLMAVDIFTNDSNLQEGGPVQNGQFFLTRSGTVGDEVVTLSFDTTSGFANTENADFVATAASVKIYEFGKPSTVNVTIPTGSTSLVIDIDALDDTLFDGGTETVKVAITGSSSETIGTKSSAQMGIIDNEAAPVISISASDPSADEASLDPGQFTVSMTVASDKATSISFPPAQVTGNAVNGVDYSLSSIPAVISAGSKTVNVAVIPIADPATELVEGTETATLTILNANISGNSGITGSGSATVSITDTDTATVKLLTPDAVAAEPSNNGLFVVEMSKAASTDTVVKFNLSGTGTLGTDYRFGLIDEAVESAGNNSQVGPQNESGPQGLIGFTKLATADANVTNSTTTEFVTVNSTIATNDGSVDVYVFYAPSGLSGASFDIDTGSGGSTGNLALRLFSSSGALIAESDNAAVDTGSTVTDPFISGVTGAAGIYYIQVARGTTALGTLSTTGAATTGVLGPDSSSAYKLHVSVPGAQNFGVIGAGDTQLPLTLTVIDDSVFEPTETAKVELTELTIKDVDISLAPTVQLSGTVNIADNETGAITVAGTDGIEPGSGANNGKFVFTLPSGTTSSTNTVIKWSVDPSSEADSADHGLATSGTVTIPVGSTSVTLTVPVLNNNIIEEDETLVLKFELQNSTSSPTGPTDDDLSIGLTKSILIRDDDIGVVDVDATFAPAVEGKTGKFTFFLAEPPGYPIGKLITSDRATVIEYSVTGTAIAGTDYAKLSGTATIPAFASSTDIIIDVTGAFDDLELEGNETVIVSITKLLTPTDSNISIGVGSPTDQLEIVDNDSLTVKVSKTSDAFEGGSKGIFTFETVGSGITTQDTIVKYKVSGLSSAVEGVDFAPLFGQVTISKGLAPQSATVEIDATGVYNDSLFEGNESVIIEIVSVSGGPGVTGSGSATGAIIDDESGIVTITKIDDAAEGTTNGKFQITLGGQSPLPTVIEYSVLTGNINDATPGSDYVALGPTGKITFAPFQTSTTLVVDVVDDGVSELTETVRVEVTKVLSGIGYTPAGGPATVNIFSDQEVELSVVDSVATESPLNNDSASFAVKLFNPSAGAYTSSETATVVTYQILTGNPDDAASGPDYTPLTGTVTIAANQTSALITVAANDDNLIEETEKVRIKLLNVSSGAGDITISKTADQGFVSINDNDAGFVSVKATKSPAQDNTASDVDGEFTFFLSQPSATDTVVNYSIGGTATAGAGNDYASLAGSVTIPANSTSATVLVDVFNDNIVEGTETVKVTMTSIASGDPQIKLGSLAGPTLKFQQGLGTYNSSQDTFISLAFPTVNFDGGAIEVDTDSLPVPSSAAEHGLLTFGDIFGPTAIPNGAPIQQATLALTTTFGGFVSLYDLFGGWLESTATWNGVFGGNGIQPGLDASATGIATKLLGFTTNSINVTSSVQSWSNGNPNFGWAILPDSPSIGTSIVSSEGALGFRPSLTVDLDLSATVEIVDTDKATVQVFGTTDAAEPGTQGKFIISMSNPSSTAVTVFYEDLLTGTAASGSDYVAIPAGSVVIPANTTSTTVFITPNNDSLIELPETVNLKITKIVAFDPEVTLGSPVTGTVTINDNDFGVISFGAVVNGDENTVGNTKLSPVNGTAVVSLTVPSDTDTVLALSVTGTATAGDDYKALPTLVTIPANFLSTTITIEVIDDGINEAAAESVVLKLDSIVSGNPSIFGTPTSTTVLILDDEQTLELKNVATKNAVEGTSNGEFQFQLNFPSDKPTVVTYQILNPAGGAGQATLALDGKAPDYNGSALPGSVGPSFVTGTVTIPANTTTFSLPVVPFLDFVTEGPETVELKVTSVANLNGVLNPVTNALVTINDLEYKVSVAKTDSPGAEPGPPGGSNAQFTFSLTNPLPEPTVVNYSVATGAGLFMAPAVDPITGLSDIGNLSGTLTIPANTTQVTLSVNVIDDLKLEGDETLALTITGASTAGPSYKWGPAPVPAVDSTPATQVIVDNDTTTVSVSGVGGTELGQPLASSDGKFVISQLNFSDTNTVVKYKILTSSTATSGSDYTAISTTLATIPAGQLSTWITVDVQQDNIVEPTETVNIELLSLEGPTDPGAKLGTNLGTVNIADDDTSTAFLIATSPVGFEPGTNDGVFTVFLTNPSATNTVVTFTLDGSGDATPGLGNDYQLLDKLSGTTLTIPVGSVTIPAGQTSTTIIVDVLDDNIIENDETVKVKLTSTNNLSISADTSLKTVTIQDLTGFSIDQDTAKVVVSKLVDGDENKAGAPTDGKFLLTLVPTNPNYNPLNGKFFSDENTVIEYVVQGTSTAANGSDFNLAATGTVTILSGQTTAVLTVPVLEDNLAEFTETVDIKLTSIKGVHIPAISADPTPATVSIFDDDASVLTITSPTVVEGDSGTVQLKFEVTSPTAVAGGFDVFFTVSDVTTNKSGPSDYGFVSPSPIKFSGLAGETQFIVIDVNGDNLVEANETLKVTLSSATPGAPLVIAGAIGTGTITNDDKAVFTIADVSVVENTDTTAPFGDGDIANQFVEMEFEVKISNPIDVATDIDIKFTDLTAIGGDFDSFLNIMKPVPVPQTVAGIDYDNDAANGGVAKYNSFVSFGANSTSSQKFRVRVNNDSIVEGGLLSSFGNEQFQIEMVDSTKTRNVDVSDKAIGTIIDDDSATVSLLTNDPLASEPFDTVNEGNGQFTVVQTAVSSSPTIISYTIGGSATPGSDYKALSGVVTIPAGATSAFIDVTVVDSVELEDDETVVVTLTKITSGDPDVTLSGTLAGTVTIYDDDQALVTIKANDAKASEDPLDDGQFTVSLSEISDTNTIVTYSIASGVGQATNGTDYKLLSGTVTIPAGQTEAKIDVIVEQDLSVESAETVTLTLTGLLSPSNADIKIGGANTDTVTIADDADGILVSVFNNGNGTEGVSNGSYIIKITKDDGVTPVPAPAGGLTVNYSSIGGTATAGPTGDYVALAGSIFIPPGQTTGLIDVSVNDDLLVEATETVKVSLVNTSPTTVGSEPISIGIGNATVDIIDNDKAVFTIEDLVVNEGDGSATIKVSISNKLEGISVPVTVNYTPLTATSPADFAPSGSQTVTFVPGSLAPQTVSFTIVDDAIVEGLEGFGVSLSTTYVNGPGLHVVNTLDTAVVGILDNDFQVFNVQGVKVGSSAWSATFNDFVDNTGAPVGQRGYSIPAGAAQATTLPWANINRLYVNFSQDPDPATIIPANFVLFGLQGAATPTVTGVTYDTTTNIATLTLSGNITNDRLRLLVSDSVTYLSTPLDGEWANNADSFDSGNGTPGGSFNFTFNVLPGDIDRLSTVNIGDASLAFGAIGASTDGTNAFPAPNSSTYTMFKDVDGSGTININDAAITFARVSVPLNSLPVGSPGGFGSGSSGSGDYEKEAVLRSLRGQLGDWTPEPITNDPYASDFSSVDSALESFDELDLVLGDDGLGNGESEEAL